MYEPTAGSAFIIFGVEPQRDDQRAEARLEPLIELLSGRRVVALTGAGCSTESGIPDYRGPGRLGPPRNPILHDQFMRRPEVRQRYWARATLGWSQLAGARPNPAHHALAALVAKGHLVGVITQNVDRLHHRAGSRQVVELHGAVEDVRCLGCDLIHPRAEVHARLLDANPAFVARAALPAPDGDAELDPEAVASFSVVACAGCGGVLRPDVVFFGGTVAPPVVAAAWALLAAAEVLLVIGSSLEVYSGYRFVRGAVARAMPVAIVNQGGTRADAVAACRIEARAGWVMPVLAARLGLASFAA